MSECNNCGSTDTDEWAVARDIEYQTSDVGWTYRRCRSCTVLYLHDPPVDRLGEIYPPNYYSYDVADRSVAQRVKQRLDRRLFAEFLAPIPGERIRLVDIGGGTGALATAARAADDRVIETTVVDLDPRCAEAATSAGHRYVVGNVDDVDVGEVDAVLLLNLIEHVHHPTATLGRVAAQLSPHGRILVKTPNTDSIDARIFRHRSWGGYHCPRHWVLFDPSSLRASAREAGLRVETLKRTQGAPFWSVSVFDALERRRLVKRRQGQAIHEHRVYRVLLLVTAAFDMARMRFASTSQMFAVLSRDNQSPEANRSN